MREEKRHAKLGGLSIRDMNISISKFDFSDLRECSRLYVMVFNSEPWNDHWTLKSAYSRLKDIYKSPRFYGIKATQNGKIIGVLLGNIESWYEKYHYQLKEIYTDNSFQSKGIGTKLIHRAKADLRKKDVRTVYLYTSDNKRLQKFYSRNGFSVLPEMKLMKFEMKKS